MLTLPYWLAIFLPVVMAIGGGVVAAVLPPHPTVKSLVQHFAAGVIFSVVAVELLPDVVRVHDPVEIGWTFALGVALMLGIRLVMQRVMQRRRSLMPTDAGVSAMTSATELVAVGIDIAIDGILIGIAFRVGAKEGILLTAALGLELLAIGLAVGTSLRAQGFSRVRTVLTPMALAFLMPVGAGIGIVVLQGRSTHTLAGVLSFGCAALLYLVTEELLVEAHEVADTVVTTTMFFVGFLLFLLIGMTV
jgi:ZIP family zinc transporter